MACRYFSFYNSVVLCVKAFNFDETSLVFFLFCYSPLVSFSKFCPKQFFHKTSVGELFSMMTCGSDGYRDLATLSHKTDNLKIQPRQWKNGFSSGLESCLEIKLIRHVGHT